MHCGQSLVQEKVTLSKDDVAVLYRKSSTSRLLPSNDAFKSSDGNILGPVYGHNNLTAIGMTPFLMTAGLADERESGLRKTRVTAWEVRTGYIRLKKRITPPTWRVWMSQEAMVQTKVQVPRGHWRWLRIRYLQRMCNPVIREIRQTNGQFPRRVQLGRVFKIGQGRVARRFWAAPRREEGAYPKVCDRRATKVQPKKRRNPSGRGSFAFWLRRSLVT